MTDALSGRQLTIILATVLPGVTIIILCVLFCCNSRRRKARLFRRGITPIDDDEIESWKVDHQYEERTTMCERKASHHTTRSTVSIQKPPSVIIYQNHSRGRRMSEDPSPCPSPSYKGSFEIPSTPVLARAPNSKPGLTDDTVQGDDAFIPQSKRQPSRLSKHPPVSWRHGRARSTRSLSRGSAHEQWFGDDQDTTPPRRSTETFKRSRSLHQARYNGVYSSAAKPPRASFDDDMFLGGLSPRPPVHKSEIGRAIG